MRAIFAETFGGDDPLANLRIGEVATPPAAPGTARVQVRAASLNHHDIWTLKGVSSRPLQHPQILGCDAVGTVAAYASDPPSGAPPVGSRVVVYALMTCGQCTACLSGDTMHCPRIGLLSEPPYPGAFAEYLDVPPGNLVPLPDGVDDNAAACLPTAYLTAYRMLVVRAALRPGQSVLVQGAGGGVATAAILIGRACGLTVYATSRTSERRAFAEELGAVATFDSTDPAAFKQVLARTDGGVDAVVETVGEPTWDLSLRSLRPGGTIAVAGVTGGPNPPAQLNRVFWRHLTIAGSSGGTREELVRLVSLCANGGLAPAIDSVVPFERAAEAFARLAAGQQRGKIVIRVGG